MLNVLVESKEEKEFAVLTQPKKNNTKRHVHACLKFTEVEFSGPLLGFYLGHQLLWLAACQFPEKKYKRARAK